MKYKHLVSVVLLLLCISDSNAQRASTDYDNFKKYWWYHYRLLNDFMVKGDCQGCSEPMNERDAYHTSATPSLQLGKWGDQTISLGMYLAVLATEYRLLKNAGQPTDTTVQELYYALKAFNRLDRNAEEFYSSFGSTAFLPASPADINGFFMRDDIYPGFLNDHPSLAQGVTSSRSISVVDSDFMAADPETNEMSHDQVWHLFMGFALVSTLVDGISYQGLPLNDLTYNINIKQEAKDITDRIMNHISDNNWVIKNPVTGANVARGDIIGEFSYGAAEAGCFIKNENSNVDMGYPIHTCTTYHDWISYGDAILWNEFGKPPGPGLAYTVTDEDYKPQVIAAVGHSWYTSMYAVIPNPIAVLVSFFNGDNWLHPWTFVTQYITQNPLLPENVTMQNLGIRSQIRDWQHLPLLHQLLHGGGNPVPLSTYYNLLDNAPCEGPYNFGYPASSAHFEWSTDNRMLSPDRRGDYTFTTPFHTAGEDRVAPFYGEYNGLDYMLYHNLFALAHGINIPFFDYMDRRVTNTFPYPISGGYVGLYPDKAIIEGFNSINASNIINSNGYVDYRAGREIHLGAGFHATNGCEFHAYIDPFACDGGTYRMATSNDSSNEEQMNNAVAYAGQTTFIKYPPQKNNKMDETENEAYIIAQNNYSEIEKKDIQVSSSNKIAEIRIQPNPNKGRFEVIVVGQEIVKGKLTLYTMLGNPVLEQEISIAVTHVDISDQAKGIYYVKIESDKVITMEKIIYQ